MKRFNQFFSKATGFDPYEYQSRLACGERGALSDHEWLSRSSACESKLIDVPTGLGKTAAVVLAWLWNRAFERRDEWPRRLVYCLPMRTLVEQTRDNVQTWIANLCQAADELKLPEPVRSDLIRLHEHSPVVLMGGEELDKSKRNWDIHPENPVILIGTQDMLLSRALNRGYGMSRFRWPMHFALLNNDCLWVMDEVQLMGSGLWTTAQLDWMRQDRFQSFKPCVSWWMSATLGGGFLETQDRSAAKIPTPEKITLSPKEESSIEILKAVRPIMEYLNIEDKKKIYFHNLAQSVVKKHIDKSLTMVVCNRVTYAQELKEEIENVVESESSRIKVLLLTSRFRQKDRKEILKEVIAFEEARKKGQTHPGLILVSTQVIEAGFDVSAARLWTEASPWSSFVQRLGRLNRDGKLNQVARAFVFTVPVKKDVGPYDPKDVKTGKKIVSVLVKLCAEKPDISSRQLLIELAKSSNVVEDVRQALKPKPEPFPRAIDVHGLFPTDPDVFGGFMDISLWVRNIESNVDVTVFWRKFNPDKDDPNSFDGLGLSRDELCPVSTIRLNKFLEKSRKAWFWESKKKCWEPIQPREIRPGMTLMLPASYGGYEVRAGWTGEPSPSKDDEDRNPLTKDVPPSSPFEDDEDHKFSIGNWWVSLETHLSDVRNVASQIACSLELNDVESKCLLRAAELHDIGKSLDQWQNELPTPHPKEGILYAKFPYISPFHPGFCHEAASALAMWQQYYRSENAPDFPALAIYIVAAHHGRIRTTLWANSRIPEPNICGIRINDSTVLPWNPAWKLDFEATNGGASGKFDTDSTFVFEAPGWSGLIADLLGGWEENAPKRTCGAVRENELHSLGPFALSYFELLLRAADGRGSVNPSQFLKHG